MASVIQEERLRRREQHLSLADQVFEAVKRAIIENRLPPETILTEAAVASQHSVSRAPAREALKRLSTFGFLRAVPRLGYIVPTISLRDLSEILALRLALEPLAVELAMPRLADEDFDRLEELGRRVLKVPHEPLAHQGSLYAQLNADFHCTIAHASGNRRLEQMISRLVDELGRIMHTLGHKGSFEPLLDQHLVLSETMRTGDAQTAAALMRQHLQLDYEVWLSLAPAAGG